MNDSDDHRTRRLIEAAVRASGDDGLEAISRTVSHFAGRPIPSGTVERRLEVLAGYKEQLAKLLLAPGIPQRTPEWYAARENMVTGSELYKAIEGRMDKFFQAKCFVEMPYVNPEDQNDTRTIEQARQWLVGKIGENIQIRRFQYMALGG